MLANIQKNIVNIPFRVHFYLFYSTLYLFGMKEK